MFWLLIGIDCMTAVKYRKIYIYRERNIFHTAHAQYEMKWKTTNNFKNLFYLLHKISIYIKKYI